MDKAKRFSRRAWLKLAALTAAVSALPFPRSLASASATKTPKASKASVHYEDTPKDGKMCGMCKYYIPPGGHAGQGMMGGTMGPAMMAPGTCQLVEGKISPRGYCILYTPI